MIARPTDQHTQLLRAALLRGEPALAAWRAWRASVDLDRLDPASSALLPLLGRNLLAHDVTASDLRFFRWVHRGVWAENMRRFDAAARVLAACRAEGLETMLLKGAALATTAYPDAGLRAMVDVDLLVRPAAAAAAMRLLRDRGWTPVGWAPFCRAPEMTLPVRHSHAFAHASGQQVDLHWHILWHTCRDGDDDGCWARSSAMVMHGVETRVLAPADQLLHACVLAGRWEVVPNLRWAADALAVLASPAGVEWPVLLEEARARRVAPVVAAALDWLARMLDAPVPAGVLEALRTSPSTRVERLQSRLESRPHGRAGALGLLALHQVRVARASGGWPLLGLPAYLRRMYEVERPSQWRPLLAHAWRRGDAA